MACRVSLPIVAWISWFSMSVTGTVYCTVMCSKYAKHSNIELHVSVGNVYCRHWRRRKRQGGGRGCCVSRESKLPWLSNSTWTSPTALVQLTICSYLLTLLSRQALYYYSRKIKGGNICEFRETLESKRFSSPPLPHSLALFYIGPIQPSQSVRSQWAILRGPQYVSTDSEEQNVQQRQ